MPVWFELMVVLLAAYGLGLGIGWLLWGSSAIVASGTDKNDTDDQAKGENTQ